MSSGALFWAMNKDFKDINVKMCLAVLAHRQNPNTLLCCPSIQMIAVDMGVKSKNTVKRAIHFLEENGLISSKRCFNSKGEIVKTEYTLHVESKAFDMYSGGAGHVVTHGHEMTHGGSGDNPRVGHVVTDVGHSVTEVGHVVTPNKEIEQGSKQVIPTTAENESNETSSMFEGANHVQKKKARDPVVKLPEQLPEDWEHDRVLSKPTSPHIAETDNRTGNKNREIEQGNNTDVHSAVFHADVSDLDLFDELPPVDDSDIIPTQVEIVTEPKRTRKPSDQRKRSSPREGTRIDPNLELPDDWREICERLDPDLDPNLVFDNFKNYWLGVSGKGALKADWKATWRNCVSSYRNAPDWKRNPMLKKNFVRKDPNVVQAKVVTHELTQEQRKKIGYGICYD